MHIHFIIHEHFEAPGAYEHWAKCQHSPEREIGKFPITLLE